jgi:hypothetical protein
MTNVTFSRTEAAAGTYPIDMKQGEYGVIFDHRSSVNNNRIVLRTANALVLLDDGDSWSDLRHLAFKVRVLDRVEVSY